MEHGSARIGEIFNFGMLHLEWPTALFILVVFFVTMIVLNTLLFKPILKTLEARQAEIDQKNSSAEKNNQTVERLEEDYQEKLAGVRSKIQEARQQSLNEALEESKRVVTESQEETAKKMGEADIVLNNERTQALSRAAALTESLSQLIKNKIIA